MLNTVLTIRVYATPLALRLKVGELGRKTGNASFCASNAIEKTKDCTPLVFFLER